MLQHMFAIAIVCLLFISFKNIFGGTPYKEDIAGLRRTVRGWLEIIDKKKFCDFDLLKSNIAASADELKKHIDHKRVDYYFAEVYEALENQVEEFTLTGETLFS